MVNRIFFIAGLNADELERLNKELRRAHRDGQTSLAIAMLPGTSITIVEISQDSEPRVLTLSEFAQAILNDNSQATKPE